MNVSKILLFLFFSVFVSASYALTTSQAALESTALPLELPEEGSLMVIVGLNVPASGDGFSQQHGRASRAVQEKLLDSLSEDQVQAYARFERLPFIALRVDGAALQSLYESPLVTSVQEDVPMPPLLDSSTALIGAPALWQMGYEGTGQAVVLLDTGIDATHPFFGGRVVAEACFSNAGGTGGGTTLCPNGTSEQIGSGAADATIAACDGGSLCRHGSHVAGIGAGDGVSFNGVAHGADIIAIQVFTRLDGAPCEASSCALSYISDQLKALDHVVTLSASHEIAAVNISLGYSAYSDQALCDAHNHVTKMAIDTLRSLGIATIIAAGNDGATNALTVPACISSAVAVSATTDEDQLASFSNIHEMVDLLAPGVSITSSIPGNDFATINGTSVAAPHVTGAWALLKSMHPSATVDEILSALQESGVLISDTRPNGTISKPRIQLDLAAQRLMPTIWLGESASWQDANNWSTGRVPSCIGASATIPSSPAGGHFPTIDDHSAAGSLIIENGAQLTMSAHTLSICGDLHVQGTGVLDATGGTLLFKGQRPQTIRLSNGQFFTLQIGDGNRTPLVTLESDVQIKGDLNIMSGASLDGSTHTINLAGNWHEHVNGFLPGSSQVILHGEQQSISKINSTLVLTETFSERDDGVDGYFYLPPPLGWTVTNQTNETNGTNETNETNETNKTNKTNQGLGYPWLFGYSTEAPNTPDSGGHARYISNGSPSASGDTWLITPHLTLHRALTYRLEFTYGAHSALLPEKLEVGLGSEPSAESMTTLLHSAPTITNTTWQTATITFTVPSDGIYHVGFHANSEAGSELALDNITLSAIQELTFHNLTVNGHATLQRHAQIQNNLLINPNALFNLGTNDITVEGTVTNLGELEQTQAISDPSGNTTYDFLSLKNTAGNQTKYHGVQITPDGGAALGMTSVRIGGHQKCTSPTDPQIIRRCFEITPNGKSRTSRPAPTPSPSPNTKGGERRTRRRMLPSPSIGGGAGGGGRFRGVRLVPFGDITPSTPHSATIRYYFSEAERNNVAANAINVWDWRGSAWVQEGDSPSYGENGAACTSDATCWYQWQHIDSFSPMSGGDGASAPTNPPAAAPPLAVTLAHFTATEAGNHLLVTWETVSEPNTLGFNLYRSQSPEQIGAMLNQQLIPSQAPGSGQGFPYEVLDAQIEANQTYYYWLEDLDISGQSSLHGPISVTTSAPTSIQLASLETSGSHAEGWAFVLITLIAVGVVGMAKCLEFLNSFVTII